MFLWSMGSEPVSAQDPSTRYRIEGGLRHTLTPPVTDSLAKDSLQRDSATLKALSLTPLAMDTTTTPRERRRQARLDRDTVTVRYSRLFRDTIPISRVCAFSAIAPGFGQLYNKQAWKIPLLYGTVGTAAYFAFQQNSKYREYRSQYDALKRKNATQEELDPVEGPMIRHNTARTLLFVGAIGSYLYFIGDAALNYKGPVNSIKKATTLSTICPGAGQIYNKSYWKVPIVLGGIATMGYTIDFNNRGYERFKLAYDLATDGDPNTVDEFNGRYEASYLKKLKDNYRRNRDLCIIITAGLYILNIIDAHVDAHMKDYDISDDLSMTLEPTMVQMYTMRTSSVNGLGVAFRMNF
ncbi:MAG: DUF5683 domain-containing protein [Alistipes sp.]|nr:DUF5683 domain-containing protein [Alistipes sp.]